MAFEILGPNGQPVQSTFKKELLDQEIAAASMTGVRSPIAGYPADGLDPSQLGMILREADHGNPLRYFELAELIEERDAHYLGVLGTRKRSVSQIPIRVEAASDDASHMAHADMVRTWLKRDTLQAELRDILDAIGKGISFTEIVWDTSEGQYMPAKLIRRDQRWFCFATTDLETPLLRNGSGDEALPMYKFIVAKFQAKSGLAVRSGIARVAAWNWMWKKYTEKDWAIFSQVYGQPIRIGKYNAGANPKQQDTLLQAVTNIAADCAAIIPETMMIEFIESKGADKSAANYEARCKYLDQQLSKLVLGQTASTDAIAGGHAVGRQHREVQKDIEASDAKDLSAVLNEQLIKPWIDLEFGRQKAYPRLVIEHKEDTDITAMADALDKLVPQGLKVSAQWVRDQLGAPEPVDDADIFGAGVPPPTLPNGKFPAIKPLSKPPVKASLNAASNPAENGDLVDQIAEQGEDLAQPDLDDLIDAVRQLFDEAVTLEDVRAGLLTLYPKLDSTAMANAMRLALVFSELSGMDNGQ
jgi:phage gp29-like protein